MKAKPVPMEGPFPSLVYHLSSASGIEETLVGATDMETPCHVVVCSCGEWIATTDPAVARWFTRHHTASHALNRINDPEEDET